MFKNLFKISHKTNTVPLLMTPGPVLVPDDIMEVFGRPIIHHRTEGFEIDLKYVLEKLPQVFKTKQQAFLHTSTGSGAMESAIVNTLSPDDTILTIVNGKFGERWTEMSKAFGLKVIEYNVEWGKSFEIQKVKDYFSKHPEIKAVACQACETSTGALNPIHELCTFVSQTQAITIVDAITALGATRLDMDAWNIDVVLGGSQKAFMLPTGLSMISFSEKAWRFIETSKLPKYYWDIRKEKKTNQKNQTYFSSPVSIIRALKTSLDIILEVGVDAFVERHELIAHAVREYGKDLGLEVFAQTPSPTITAFKLPPNINGEKVQFIMEHTHGITIGGGQEHLKGKIIRIGHMGAIERDHIMLTFEKLQNTLAELGHQKQNVNHNWNLIEKLKPLPKVKK